MLREPLREPLTGNAAWIQTYSGKPFWPLDPRPEDLDIIDIAHALSMQCRYAGHVHQFYSVAEHSLYISQKVDPVNALWGLLHDASEAYLVDVPRPLKPFLPDYKEWERTLMMCIAHRYGLTWPEPSQVKEFDTRILYNERSALLSTSVLDWNLKGDPIPDLVINAYDPETACRLFLKQFYLLTN